MGLVIVIEPHGTYAIYEQIVNQIKNQIISGELQPDEALPSIRGLAADIGVSVITTKHAYEELEREGLIRSVSNKGFYVCKYNTDYLHEKQLMELENACRSGLRLQNRRDLELRIFVRCWRDCCKMEDIIFLRSRYRGRKRYSAKAGSLCKMWILNFQVDILWESSGKTVPERRHSSAILWRKRSIIAAAFIWTEPISRRIMRGR